MVVQRRSPTHRAGRFSAARLLAAACVGAALLSVSAPADAVIVERVVAVIGDEPILLSELRERGRPMLMQIHRKVPPGAQRNAAMSKMYKDLLELMVEEELEARAAIAANIEISPAEIDNAFAVMAKSSGKSVQQIIDEAKTLGGISEQDYREVIRRQILEGKMLQLRVKGRIRVTEEELRSMYEKTVREERKIREYRPAWIVLKIRQDATAEEIANRLELANQLSRDAKNGDDFTELAAKYSDETKTRDIGGDLGIRAPNASQAALMGKREVLSMDLEDRMMALEPGGVTEPIRVGESVIIMKLLSRQPSRYTTFDAAEQEMMQRVQNELLGKARKQWLEELRRKTPVEIRH